MLNLHGLGAFLAGAAIFGAATFAVGFATGYVAGLEGPVFNLQLENSTVSFCAPGSPYNSANATMPLCPEVMPSG